MKLLAGLQAFLDSLFDLVLLPLSPLEPGLRLAVLSLLAGVAAGTAFSLVSRDARLPSLRRRILSLGIGMALSISRPPRVMALAARMLWSSLLYLLTLSLRMLPAAPLFLAFYAQAGARFSSRVPESGSDVVVEYSSVPLEPLVGAIEGASLRGPVLRFERRGLVAFRVLGASGRLMIERLVVDFGGEPGRVAASGFVTRPTLRALLDPSTRCVPARPCDLPAGAVFGMEPVYYRVMGGWWSWLAVFLAVSSAGAMAAGAALGAKV